MTQANNKLQQTGGKPPAAELSPLDCGAKMVADTCSFDAEFARLGHAIVPGVLSEAELPGLRHEADRLIAESSERGGARNILRRSGLLGSLARRSTLVAAVSEILGRDVRVVKATLFDKTPSFNWKVPFHQDVTITVRERVDVPGFGPWSVKDGAVNVQAPEAVLRQLVAARVHLDDADEGNGALRVVDGSHLRGRLKHPTVSQGEPSLCPVSAGNAMLMSPLLLHASSPSEAPTHRRVIHFEFTASGLPGGLEWN